MLLSVAFVLGLPAISLGAVTPAHQRGNKENATPLFTRAGVTISEARPENQAELSQHPSPNVLVSPLRERIAAKNGQPSKKRAIKAGNETVNTIFSGVYPVLNITWWNKDAGTPGQQIVSYIDTGSSDTWAVTDTVECVNINTRQPQTQAACDFGPLYNTEAGSFSNLTSDIFSISYFPEMESLRGNMGYAPVTFAGLYVPKAEVALVDYAAWAGDGTSSGLLGLAYEAVTSASVKYPPIFTAMVSEGIVTEAVFTLATDRVPQGTSTLAPAGLIAFGGLVPAKYYEAPFTSVPIEKTDGELAFYTITHELVYGKTNESVTSGGSFQSIVDCGTSGNFVPTERANAINALFDPPAVYNATLEYYVTSCNATVPYVAYVIDNVTMPMDPQDMIVPSLNGLPGYEDVCFSAFADGGADTPGNSFIIGSVWQRSYVIVFDQARTMLHFAHRTPY